MALHTLACCFSTLKDCVPDVFNGLCSDKEKTVLRPGFPGAGSQSPEWLSSGLQSTVWLRKSQASLYSYCGLFIDYFHQQEQEAQSLTAENWGMMGRWAAPWWGPCGLWGGGQSAWLCGGLDSPTPNTCSLLQMRDKRQGRLTKSCHTEAAH